MHSSITCASLGFREWHLLGKQLCFLSLDGGLTRHPLHKDPLQFLQALEHLSTQESTAQHLFDYKNI